MTMVASDDNWWEGVLTEAEARQMERTGEQIIADHEEVTEEGWMVIPVGVGVTDFHNILHGVNRVVETLDPSDPTKVFLGKLVACLALEYTENDLIDADEESTAIYRQYFGGPDDWEDDGEQA